jgi:hypothetical protein
VTLCQAERSRRDFSEVTILIAFFILDLVNCPVLMERTTTRPEVLPDLRATTPVLALPFVTFLLDDRSLCAIVYSPELKMPFHAKYHEKAKISTKHSVLIALKQSLRWIVLARTVTCEQVAGFPCETEKEARSLENKLDTVGLIERFAHLWCATEGEHGCTVRLSDRFDCFFQCLVELEAAKTESFMVISSCSNRYS